ncbi:hypothetical protein [Streptomyces enissocaesilis]|uniref:Uncharacterized protein n=1 Tax=Streptomyces enissocaesilis TaxID=332589 RepID=A0ABN3XP54_9ACTN
MNLFREPLGAPMTPDATGELFERLGKRAKLSRKVGPHMARRAFGNNVRYLDDLLRSRERLMSAFEADDWARSEAAPSEEEIRRVRRLINRVKADLDDLSPGERSQIEEAVAVVRRSPTVMLGMPRIAQPMPDVRPWRLP